MSTKYWDIYVLYIERCVKDNYENDIDPAHYEMEWNHFWPKCIFGEWPVGQWLTLRQHAIASALQTLVFRRKCMHGKHKSYLPPKLLELAWPYYCEASGKIGKETISILHSSKNECGKSLFALMCHTRKDENGKSLHSIKIANNLHRQKDSNGRSLHGVKSGERTREIQGKRVLVTFPDGSTLSFLSLKETAKHFNIQSEYVRKRIRKGPAQWGKLSGLRFELVE